MNLRREVGFWPLLGELRLRQFAGPELLGAALIGLPGGVALLIFGNLWQRTGAAGDYLVIVGALLGIVFAALSLVVGLLSDSYLRWLKLAPKGVLTFLAPFMVTLGIHVATVLGAVLYRAAASLVPSWLEGFAFVVLTLLFVYALLEVVALARAVLAHGLRRARAAELGDPDENVAQFRQPSARSAQDRS